MASDHGYSCACCGGRHGDVPMNFSSPAPVHWDGSLATDPDSLLTDDRCVIEGEHFFVRGMVELPVIGSDEVFSWGVWVSLSAGSYARSVEVWDEPGRENEPSAFGWFSTELPVYRPTTVNLKTRVHTRPVGERPWIELEPTDHPLAVEQRTGITMGRVREIADAVLNAGR
ncbi:DUF2199 domain-containing protein [Streptomyces sp. NRRL B-24484]|uniref:DUF2199 domain-containing protein n=1 Tax=Streptomyces sp. NRRL B-24484 TaxID=1463833 RepID=UPI000997C64B|nr:DUF2199 domain-containing protein [Streptomyces sp. NRRL B-24484]